MRRFFRRIRNTLRHDRLHREIADELADHLEREAALLEAEGRSPLEARRLARARFGAMDGTIEDVKRERGLGWAEDLARDIALALRAFGRRRGLPMAVAGTLALGIGASTLVFAAVRAVLLEPLPYYDPDHLAFVWRTAPGVTERLRVPGPDAAEIAQVSGVDAVAFLAPIANRSLARPDGPAVPMRVATVSANWFDVLGVQTALGRGLAAADGQVSAENVWLLDDGFFRSRLGGDPAVIGRTIELDGQSGVVIGVLPPRYRLVLPPDLGYPAQVDAWQPLRTPLANLDRPDRERDQDSDASGVVVTRLARETSLQRVQSALDALALAMRERVPFYDEAGYGLSVRPLHADAVSRARPVLGALLGAVLLVLLLSATNAAGLLLTRAIARSRELAVRAALGAQRSRLIRLIVTEHAVLAAAGGIGGVVLALLATPLLQSRLSSLVPHARLHVDGLVLSFVAVALIIVVFATSFVVLLDPAIRLAAPSGLAARGATATGRAAHRLRAAVVAAQVAISLVLVAGAGVMLRTAERMAAQDLGFRANDVLAFRVGLAFPDRYRGPAERAAVVRELESRVRTLPGVRAVGIVGGLPLADPEFTQPWSPANTSPAAWGAERANYRVVTAGWFDAMDTRVVHGRAFRAEDDRQDRRVVIIDAHLAERLAPLGDAVGRMLSVPVDGAVVDATVVGVVENVRYESPTEPGRPTIYVPYRHEASRRIAFVVRTEGEPGALIPEIAETLASVDPRIAMHDATPLSAVVQAALRPTRDVMHALSAFGLAALILAVAGLHAAVAYGVARRTAEIGLRRALGATEWRVVSEAMRSGLVPCGAGLLAGAALTTVGARGLRALVYGVSPLDPASIAAAVLIIGGACIGACLLAARRAARIEPGVALGGVE